MQSAEKKPLNPPQHQDKQPGHRTATKGAIISYTRSLSQQLVKQGIYVNAVAPGPVCR